MAESNRQSAGRKRKKAGEEEPPIVQLSSAQLCGCLKCWKQATIRSPNRRSARLAAKKPKRAGGGPALDHEPQLLKNSFVYEGHTLDKVVACSADGRHMYLLTAQMDLHVVDLLLNTRKLVKPRTAWDRRMFVWAFVALSNTAILLAAGKESDWEGHDELHLLRFGADSDEYEGTLLDSCFPGESRMWALTEVSGQDVDLKRAVVGHFGPLHFCRLDVDEARMIVDDTIDFPDVPQPLVTHVFHGPLFFAQMGKDGRQLYALDAQRPDSFHVYSLEQKKWTEEKLAEMPSNQYIDVLDFNPTADGVYLQEDANENSVPFLKRCNFEAKKWDELPIRSEGLLYVFPILNPADGEEDGLATVQLKTMKQKNDKKEVERFKVDRHMFRRPESLRLLSLLAARKSREEVDGDEGFQQKMSVRPHKSCFPPVFEGMTPIPVRSLE